MLFWDKAAGVYDLFVNVVNRKVHKQLRAAVAELIGPEDAVLECACGTGMLTEVIAPRCKKLTATDFSVKMLAKARKKCAGFGNVTLEAANILRLDYPDDSFDCLVAANVLHLLDDPLAALSELDRVCRPGGRMIIPTYINKNEAEKTSRFAAAVGKAGADFKRQFTATGYFDFFVKAGYSDADIRLIQGRIPCAVAVMKAKSKQHRFTL